MLLVLLPAGAVVGQGWHIGVALEGQIFPLGLTGFFEYQQGAYGAQVRVGWDLFGGLYVGSESFWEPIENNRFALGLLIYPGVARAAPDLDFTGVMLFPNVGARRPGSGWAHLGLGLPLQSSFYEHIQGDWGFLALLRTRLQIVRARTRP
ncbi:hypothetical protein ABUL39_09760 [Rhodothermus marinus]|uniref:hypothetical protein n=1 Tax=Rhodothermus marinus TaxID=29549 RepID=UPI0037CB9975